MKYRNSLALLVGVIMAINPTEMPLSANLPQGSDQVRHFEVENDRPQRSRSGCRTVIGVTAAVGIGIGGLIFGINEFSKTPENTAHDSGPSEDQNKGPRVISEDPGHRLVYNNGDGSGDKVWNSFIDDWGSGL